MKKIDVNKTVGELVKESPARGKVFEKYYIDYCCGGKLPLREVCETKQLDIDRLIAELTSVAERPSEKALTDLSLKELVEDIINTHHQYLREELPRIDELLKKVINRHGEKHPELEAIGKVFYEICHEIAPHLEKEEQVLFPMILRIDNHTEGNGFSVSAPISCMEAEHQHLGDYLKKMRELTSDFTPPSMACNSFRVLYSRLDELEKDIHVHIHKENNLLFPKAISAEKKANK